MECIKCMAFGVDEFGFPGCLVKNPITGTSNNTMGCENTNIIIADQIKEVKKDKLKAEKCIWFNDKTRGTYLWKINGK